MIPPFEEEHRATHHAIEGALPDPVVVPDLGGPRIVHCVIGARDTIDVCRPREETGPGRQSRDLGPMDRRERAQAVVVGVEPTTSLGVEDARDEVLGIAEVPGNRFVVARRGDRSRNAFRSIPHPLPLFHERPPGA